MRRCLTRSHKASWPHIPNRLVFKRRLNCPRESHCRSSAGKEFQSRGPAAAKHRSP